MNHSHFFIENETYENKYFKFFYLNDTKNQILKHIYFIIFFELFFYSLEIKYIIPA